MTIAKSFNRVTLLTGSAVALAWAVPGAAQTQDVPVGTAAAGGQGETVLDPEPQTTEDVVVTGTRLARDPNEVAPSPISTVTAADIRSTGQVDASETLREIPALSNSITIGDSLERDVGTNLGVASLDLRGLGVDRTLVVVNGRRHVAGVPGSQAVDISTIPNILIDRVEVLTGGASAVYGADAVTGVVNFVLKRDFEGLDLNVTQGISDEGDGRQFTLDAAIGKNFDEGRGNITLAGSYTTSDELQYGDRPYTANNARANVGQTYPNPALRFQRGDITGATPNFARLYQLGNFDEDGNQYFPYGYRIPSAAAFSTEYQRLFGTAPSLTSAEQALIARTQGAPSLAFQSFPSFAISSTAGLIARDDYQGFIYDANRNGVQDCDESFIGVTTVPNFFGGCYVSTPGGGVKIFEDGLIASGSNQFGGDGAAERFSAQSLLPRNMRVNVNLLTQYEYSDALTLFAEGKYVRTETRSQNPYNTFYDSLYIAPDNPFIPAVLRADAVEAGGLRVSRDFTDLGPGFTEAVRDTYRIVGGARGAITPELSYEVATNYGRTDSAVTFSNSVLYDRLFAAIDVVQGPNGPRCRSDTDPTPYRGSEFFPFIEGGFFTFRPGDGQCAPVSLFNGSNSVSQAGVDFITAPTTTRARVEQFVASASLVGNTGAFFNLPGGAVQFALGGEYREESSRTRFDPLDLGLLPSGSPAGPAGTFIGDLSSNQALTFDAQTRIFNSGGAYDVKEVYGEIRLPLAKGRPFFEQLELSGAARYSDYSTVGGTFTWNVNGVYAPISDIRLRGTYAQAIRAPNIAELFNPQQGTVFRPADPCDAAQIASAPDPARRQANCQADGLPIGFEDPLSARFSGTTGGNPDLREETAKTYTFGGVLAPRFIPGLVISADYYNIEIEDAINAVSAQDIVDSCYDAATIENQYCDLFTRNRNPASPTFLGLNFLRQTQLNFGRIETSGIDATISYQFRLGENRFQLRATGNWTEKLNFFFDPGDPTANDPELGEQGRPEFGAVGSVNWQRGPFSLGYRVQYIDGQTIGGVEIETADRVAGPAGFVDELFVHDVSFNFDLNDRFSLYGGVNNVTDVDPYRTNTSYPVSPLGRFPFLGVRVKTGPLF
ncbi:TonB-dependent receptor domain-containing protein [Sphingomonas lenta]|uniref:TonB-dependent receptor n=1 Tax=Sphingomonas lenta TaxID=1141887 RepID=A0A2A2SKF4_9SPHN|nr:TonB-dependent receptor [Sphingomonas lenta]PAX09491.1 TonB-dependent receptor [Sphingomonas lenta]